MKYSSSVFFAILFTTLSANAARPTDNQAPIVTITAQPASTIYTNSASVSFTVKDPNKRSSGINRAECSLDNAAYAVCTSPVNLTNLSVASHSLGIRAFDNAGNMSNSVFANFTVGSQPAGDTQAPTVPAGLAGSALSSSQIKITWSASSDNVGVSGYNIYRGGIKIATSAINSFTDSGLSASTNYSYNVSAYDAVGNTSAMSAAVSASTPAAPDTQAPTVPAGLAGSALSSSQIKITWSASSDNVGVSGYNIYRNGTKIATSAVTSYTDSGLSASTNYSYNVSAYDAVGNTSAMSAAVAATTLAATAPAFVTGVTTSTSGGVLTLSGPVQGLRYSYDSSGGWINLASPFNSPYTISKTWPVGTTFVCAQALGTDGTWHGNSLTEVQLCNSVSVPAPVNTATLTWNPNTEIDLAGYKVCYGTQPGNYSYCIDVRLPPIQNGLVTYTISSGLQSGFNYYFAVKAYDTGMLESGYSNEGMKAF